MLLFFLVLFSWSCDIGKTEQRWHLGGAFPIATKYIRSTGIKFELLYHKNETIPEEFDAREKWPQCESIKNIVDQGWCSSCWAVVTAATLTDRVCIASNGEHQFEFSAEDLLTCCDECVKRLEIDRCHSVGLDFMAVNFWIKAGLVSGGELNSERGCKPYSETVALERTCPSCQLTCTNPSYGIPYNKDKHYGAGCRIWQPSIPLEFVQSEIMTHGPVNGYIKMNKHLEENAGTEVYYNPDTSDLEYSWQTVKIIGWGVENNVSFWLVANSWGEKWGRMGGFFKVLRGEDHLGIESSFLAPDVAYRSSSPKSFLHVLTHTWILLYFLLISFLIT